MAVLGDPLGEFKRVTPLLEMAFRLLSSNPMSENL